MEAMKYRLTIYPALEADSTYKLEQRFMFLTELEGARDLAASLLLSLQDGLGVLPAYSNMFVEEMWCEDEECWSEFY